MRFVFAALPAMIAIALSLMLGLSVYNAFTDGWQWLLVSLGILMPNVVSVLITGLIYSLAREY